MIDDEKERGGCASEALCHDLTRVESRCRARRGARVKRGGRICATPARGGVEPVWFGTEHADLAIEAFRRFGTARHPARLNFGDCFFYALAKATGEPLLFEGDGFSGRISSAPGEQVADAYHRGHSLNNSLWVPARVKMMPPLPPFSATSR